MKGNIAKRYGEVVQDLWGTSYRSIAPLKLRVSLKRFFSSIYTFLVFTFISVIDANRHVVELHICGKLIYSVVYITPTKREELHVIV